MRINQRYHLTYCTNIHPGKDWELSFSELKKHLPVIKKEVAPNSSFGVGLRLSELASQELDQANNLQEFKYWLDLHDMYVFTMNGFPYGNFHHERVKDLVHQPDWTTEERLSYTKRLFKQLVFLVPKGMSGGISTSPISYKHWHKSEHDIKKVQQKAAKQLSDIVLQLYEIEHTTATYLHLDIEPEPDGLLENSDDIIHFFKEYLIPIAKDVIKDQIEKPADELEGLIRRYITVCYDTCHFALAYEDPKESIQKIRKAGIQIGKVQLSAALKILFDKENDKKIWDSLARFNEPVYLHQVTEKSGNEVKTYADLPLVLDKKDKTSEIRAHFHVPIFLDRFDLLQSTQEQLIDLLQYLKTDSFSEHLEIETYTWEVLPTSLKTDLSGSIIREINWVIQQLDHTR